MQRTWLKATRVDLSLQPLTGILFLMQRILGGETKELSPAHVGLVQRSYKQVQDVFETRGTIAMLFRIGQGGKPSARSTRLPPEVKIEEA